MAAGLSSGQSTEKCSLLSSGFPPSSQVFPKQMSSNQSIKKTGYNSVSMNLEGARAMSFSLKPATFYAQPVPPCPVSFSWS